MVEASEEKRRILFTFMHEIILNLNLRMTLIKISKTQAYFIKHQIPPLGQPNCRSLGHYNFSTMKVNNQND